MNRHNILYSHYAKYKKSGGVMPNSDGKIYIPIREDMILSELLKQSSGLVSDEIVSFVHEYYSKYNKQIGVKSIINPRHIFNIVQNKSSNVHLEPLYRQGNMNAVYMINDPNNIINDNGELILKIFPLLYDDKSQSLNTLFNDLPKVKQEYIKYNKYLPRIYFYGLLDDENPDYVKPTTTSYLKSFFISVPKPASRYKPVQLTANADSVANYVITKKYKSLPELSDEFESIYHLSNYKKLLFLLSNITMLNTLYNDNKFHSDYKPSNIGWDNDDTMEVILLDYEDNTIISTDDRSFFEKRRNGNINPMFPVTDAFVPKYFANNDIKEFSNYNKWSVGGLGGLIVYLNIQYKNNDIKFPPEISNLTLDSTISTLEVAENKNLLNLYSQNYDDIPSYEELGKIFRYILDNNLYI